MLPKRLLRAVLGLHVAAFILALVIVCMTPSGTTTSNKVQTCEWLDRRLTAKLEEYTACKADSFRPAGCYSIKSLLTIKDFDDFSSLMRYMMSGTSTFGPLTSWQPPEDWADCYDTWRTKNAPQGLDTEEAEPKTTDRPNTGTGRRLLALLEPNTLGKTALKGGDSDSGEKFFNGVAPLVLGVAVTGMILSLMFILLLAIPRLYDATILKADMRSPPWAKWPFAQLIVSAVWWILWLAAVASVSTTYEVKNASKGLSQNVGVIVGVCAMLWLAWLLTSALVALSAYQMHHNIKAGRIQAAATDIAVKHTDIENPDPKATRATAPPKVSFVKHHSPKHSPKPSSTFKADKATMDMLYGPKPDVTGSKSSTGGAHAPAGDQAVGADNQAIATDLKSEYEVVNLDAPARE